MSLAETMVRSRPEHRKGTFGLTCLRHPRSPLNNYSPFFCFVNLCKIEFGVKRFSAVMATRNL